MGIDAAESSSTRSTAQEGELLISPNGRLQGTVLQGATVTGSRRLSLGEHAAVVDPRKFFFVNFAVG